MLSKASQYAIKSLIFIGSQPNRVTLKDVSKAIDSPPAFTSKILQRLVAAQIVDSIKGIGGGFEINPKKLKTIKLVTIMKAIESCDISTSCFLGFPKCSDQNPCPVHHLYKPIKEKLNTELLNVSLKDIMDDPKAILFQ
ncbi:MAG: Rrf2 family transcriptional regulator [Chitinophagales bacterium]|nr:Rrf2 family transcriptional regulator [Chitinophagales bacterium]